MSISNWFSSEREAAEEPCLMLPHKHDPALKTCAQDDKAVSRASIWSGFYIWIPAMSTKAQSLGDPNNNWSSYQYRHNSCRSSLVTLRKRAEERAQRCGLPAVSFSSSSASSLRSCSFPTGCVAGTVTPGIWGRQHGGVRARGEFRQSRRNFLS